MDTSLRNMSEDKRAHKICDLIPSPRRAMRLAVRARDGCARWCLAHMVPWSVRPCRVVLVSEIDPRRDPADDNWLN